MTSTKRKHKHPSDLPGTIYRNKKRYWWKVQLPGEDKPKARPLKPVGSRYATTDYAVVVECARQLLQQHLFKQHVPFQGQVKTIADLVRAYMAFAQEYYVTPAGSPTIEIEKISYTLQVLLKCFPKLDRHEGFIHR